MWPLRKEGHPFRFPSQCLRMGSGITNSCPSINGLNFKFEDCKTTSTIALLGGVDTEFSTDWTVSRCLPSYYDHVQTNCSLEGHAENAGAFPHPSAHRYPGTDMAKFSFSEIEDAFLFMSSAMYGMNSATVCKNTGKILSNEGIGIFRG
jgi:hypothetical protein